MENEYINIAIQVNRGYLKYAGVMLTSLCINNHNPINLFVLNADLSEPDLAELSDCLKAYNVIINDLKVNLKDFDERLPLDGGWTIEAYFKLKLADLLPAAIDKILYLDVDIIVNGSVCDLYMMDFAGKDILAAADANGTCSLRSINTKQCEMISGKYGEDYIYFNSGVMLMNIALIREKYDFDTYRNAMNEWNFEMCAVDQDLLNYVHGNCIRYVDWNKYNLCARIASHKMSMSYNDVKSEVAIVHYTGSKPWQTGVTLHYDIEQLWWDYARITPFYEELAEEFIRTTMINPEFEAVINNTIEENRRLHELLSRCTELLNRVS